MCKVFTSCCCKMCRSGTIIVPLHWWCISLLYLYGGKQEEDKHKETMKDDERHGSHSNLSCWAPSNVVIWHTLFIFKNLHTISCKLFMCRPYMCIHTSHARQSSCPIWAAACTGAIPSLARRRQFPSTCENCVETKSAHYKDKRYSFYITSIWKIMVT